MKYDDLLQSSINQEIDFKSLVILKEGMSLNDAFTLLYVLNASRLTFIFGTWVSSGNKQFLLDGDIALTLSDLCI